MVLNWCRSEDPDRRASRELDKKISQWMKTYNKVIKLLLLGPGESGKTTVIKQMKIIHIRGFTSEERKKHTDEIRRNILEAIKELTSNMAYLQPPIPLENSENQDSLDFIHEVNMMEKLYSYPQEFYDHVSKLWKDRGVRDCFRRSTEFQLIDSAKYFLDRLDTIRDENYIPTDQDILYCRRRTSDIQKIEFSMKVGITYGGGSQEFCMYDVGGQRGERRKWITVFDGITAILFLVACSGFDSRIREDNCTNRLEEAVKVFEEVWFSRFLRNSGFILFLNKQDLLKEKINQGVKIIDFFPEFVDYKWNRTSESDSNDEYNKVKDFIRDKFVDITFKEQPTKRYSAADIYEGRIERKKREFFCHFTTATDTNSIKTVFEDIHTMIIMWNLAQITPC